MLYIFLHVFRIKSYYFCASYQNKLQNNYENSGNIACNFNRNHLNMYQQENSFSRPSSFIYFTNTPQSNTLQNNTNYCVTNGYSNNMNNFERSNNNVSNNLINNSPQSNNCYNQPFMNQQYYYSSPTEFNNIERTNNLNQCVNDYLQPVPKIQSIPANYCCYISDQTPQVPKSSHIKIPKSAKPENTMDPEQISVIGQPEPAPKSSSLEKHSLVEAPIHILPPCPISYQPINPIPQYNPQEYANYMYNQQIQAQEMARKKQECENNRKEINDAKTQIQNATTQLNAATKNTQNSCN